MTFLKQLCRGCGASEESAEHVVNCNQADITVVEDVTTLGEITKEVMNFFQFQFIFIKTVHPSWDMTTILQKYAILYFYK